MLRNIVGCSFWESAKTFQARFGALTEYSPIFHLICSTFGVIIEPLKQYSTIYLPNQCLRFEYSKTSALKRAEENGYSMYCPKQR